MDLTTANFCYSTILKLEKGLIMEAHEVFPGLHEISLSSRSFPNYTECVSSCMGLMEGMSKDLNEKVKLDRFKVGAEVNPAHTGTATMSKDWEDFEVARFWLYDKSMEGAGNIKAIGRCSVYSTPKVQNLATLH